MIPGTRYLSPNGHATFDVRKCSKNDSKTSTDENTWSDLLLSVMYSCCRLDY